MEFISFDCDFSDRESEPQDDFISDLRDWAITGGISHTTLDGLLCILRKHKHHGEVLVPKSSKTLLRISTKKVVTKKLSNSYEYWHFGVEKILNTLRSSGIPLPNPIKLTVNIDGLPIENSGNMQFWPILCMIEGIKLHPMVIGIYCGKEKPGSVKDYSCTKEYLTDFVNEMIDLYEYGYRYGNELPLTVCLDKFCNDAVANALIKECKGHTGYFSCPKCNVEGEPSHIGSNVCFPYYGVRRTDESFRKQTQKDHHNGTSILTNVSNLDMINAFPLDYLHLICLGIVKKLLLCWVFQSTRNKSSKLPIDDINLISKRLNDLANKFPYEFNRKCRGLDFLKKWKATEFRTFVLYIGVVVLKDVIDPDVYFNFLLLHIGTTICISDYHKHLVDVADVLYSKFVETFIEIYGRSYVSYNVHNLKHIVDDVRRFGSFDNFSAFPFENKLGMMKKLIRSHYLPLQQVAKRVTENLYYDINKLVKKNNVNTVKQDSIQFDDFCIDNSPNNKWFQSIDKNIISFSHTESREGNIYLVGKSLNQLNSFYDIPILSR